MLAVRAPSPHRLASSRKAGPYCDHSEHPPETAIELNMSKVVVNSSRGVSACSRGIVCLLIAIGFTIFPSSSFGEEVKRLKMSPARAEAICINNLHRIYSLIRWDMHYSAGILPFAPLDRLYGAAASPKPFICPADTAIEPADGRDSIRTSYEIVNSPLDPKVASVLTSKLAIVIEKRANHNGNRMVLFYDGSVRAFDEAAFAKLKSNLFIDGP
jgi:prepilin-type processing-associated H-X9-DG protein